jgi:hypothetical protein
MSGEGGVGGEMVNVVMVVYSSADDRGGECS